MKSLQKHIAVLKGGPSAERDVSLATGAGVANALRSLGATVTEVDVRDADFELPADVDLAFIALHGTSAKTGKSRKSWRTAALPVFAERTVESDEGEIDIGWQFEVRVAHVDFGDG